MANDDTRRYSRGDLVAMKAKGEVRPTPADAPEIELDQAFGTKPASSKRARDAKHPCI